MKKKLLAVCSGIFALSFALGLCTLNEKTTLAETAETITLCNGASVRIKNDETDKTGIRFAAKLGNYDADNGNSYGMLIVPEDYLTNITGNYLEEFAKQNVEVAHRACLPVYGDVDKDGVEEDYIQFSLTNVRYENLNRNFVGIGYIKDADGVYTYTTFTKENNSRSVAYVASGELNAYPVGTDGYNTCLTYLHSAANQKKGVSKEEGENATTSEFAITANESISLTLGETQAINVAQSPAMGYAVFYQSEDATVATVDEEGNVTAVGKGNTNILVKCADKTVSIPVTVSLEEKDVTAIGSSVSFDFENDFRYVKANNSTLELVSGSDAIEGTSLKITKTASWQGADFTGIRFAAGGSYQVSFDIKLLSGSAGQAFATFSSAANGTFQDVGNTVSVTETTTRFNALYALKDFDDYFLNLSFSDPSCVFVIDNVKIERILPALNLTAVGAKYEQNFDEAGLTTDTLGYFVPDNSTLSLVDNGNGKALQINKTAQWSGMKMQNAKLSALGTYRIVFDVKLVAGSNGNMYATCSSAANGSYQDVGHGIAPTAEWKTLTLDYTLKDFDDYFFNFSFWDGAAVVQIDNFSITRLSDIADLTTVGAKYQENFDALTAEGLSEHFISTGTANLAVENGALKVTKTGQWQGMTVTGLKMSKDATYKFSFTLNVQQMSSADFFQVVFADNTAEKVWEDLNTYAKVGESVVVEFELTLLADATEFLIGCWDGGMIYTIDNLVIERTA